MKNFEAIYYKFGTLLIDRLPEYINKVNIAHNDGQILKSFENTNLFNSCLKTPSFSFNIEESNYDEKNRIIEDEVYLISLEIKLPKNTNNYLIILFRYYEAINMLLENEGVWQECHIISTKANTIFIKILV